MAEQRDDAADNCERPAKTRRFSKTVRSSMAFVRDNVNICWVELCQPRASKPCRPPCCLLICPWRFRLDSDQLAQSLAHQPSTEQRSARSSESFYDEQPLRSSEQPPASGHALQLFSAARWTFVRDVHSNWPSPGEVRWSLVTTRTAGRSPAFGFDKTELLGMSREAVARQRAE